VVADWGIKNVIAVRSQDRIAVDNQGVALNQGVFDARAFGDCLSDECVVVTHSPGRAVFLPAPAALVRGFKENGFSEVDKKTVYDSHGLPAFEFFHVGKLAPGR
jgi:hypothetical protein